MDGYAYGCLDGTEGQREERFEEPDGRIYGRGDKDRSQPSGLELELDDHGCDGEGGAVLYGR